MTLAPRVAAPVVAARRTERARAARHEPPYRPPTGRPTYLTMPAEPISASSLASPALATRLDATQPLMATLDSGPLATFADASLAGATVADAGDTGPLASLVDDTGETLDAGEAADGAAGDADPGGSAAAPGGATRRGAGRGRGGRRGRGEGEEGGDGGRTATAPPGAGSRATREMRGGKDEAGAEEIVVPAVALDMHGLARRPLELPSTSVPFDAPRALGMEPTAKPTKPDPDLSRYASVFADAAAAAARLHANLTANAARTAEAARRSADQRADRRQRNLDDSLTRIDYGLDEARNVLNSGASDALTLLSEHASAAKSAIRGAARRARGSIKATKDRITVGKTKQQTAATKVEQKGATDIAAISSAGASAETGLQRLVTSPELTFGAVGDAMKSAKNERIALRIPPRATTQKEDMHKAAAAQVTSMTPMITKLQTDLSAAFTQFNTWLTELDGPAPQAVNSAEANSISQVRKTETDLRRAVEAGRIATEAALVEQHNAARAQLISSADQRAKQEEDQAEQRAIADVTAATSLAGSPAGTVRAVRESLEKERRRPAEDFAKVVISSAQSMVPRLDGVVTPQLTRLERRASDALGQLDRQSDESGYRMFSSVVETSARLSSAAASTGQALTKQVDGAASGLTGLAAPVTQSTARFIPNIDKNFKAALTKLEGDITAAGDHLTASLNGTGGGSGTGETPPPVPTPGPSEAPNKFKGNAERIAGAPETEPALVSFATTAGSKVQVDIETRASGINTELGSFTHTEENVFSQLRQMLPRQARALTVFFNGGYAPTLAGRLKSYFDLSITTQETWRRNSAAASAYLSGNAAEGALQEMAASVVLWNDTERLERVQRTLTPAQMLELKTLSEGPAILADVRGDIDGVDRDVFDALNSVAPSDSSGVGGAISGVGRANALRLRAKIDTARGTRGYEGGEGTYNAIRDSNRGAGHDLLSGADSLDLDTERERGERRERAWTQTFYAFATLQPLPETHTGPRSSADALIAYATGERNYAVTTGHGEDAHTEIVREGVGADHERLIGNLVRTGEGSPATRAALLVVQMHRGGGALDTDRLDEATYDADLNPDLASTDPDRVERQRVARERRRETFRLYDLYTRGEAAVAAQPADPDTVQAGLANAVGSRLQNDENRAAYARSMITEERGSPVAAFTFAVNDWGTNTDVLRRTFGRMTRDQVDQSVRDYAAAHNGESLYARLGIHGEGTWLGAELSGEERQQITVASMGVAQNDLQRAEIAAMEARLQRNEAGGAGRWLAGDEYSHLAADYNNLLGTMGKGISDTDREGNGRTSFDRLGRLTVRAPDGTAIPVGNFSADGRFTPPAGMSPEALEIAMGRSGISQRAYVAATDRIANAVTTTLVVTAAIVTTALTGGAAASIWIPVLVTAGAGLAGMAASAAIKGGRYGRDEMLKDLGTTIVQAATAGLGAAAGVALRGGAPALREVSSRMLFSEKLLERFMMAGGRGGLRQALSLGEEALVAGGTSAVGGMGQAALDSDAWHRGTWGEGIGHAGMRGFLGGALGSVVMRPVMRAGVPHGDNAGPEALGAHMLRRGLGSAVSGTTSRAVEIGYDAGRGQHMGSSEAMSELQLAFVQNFVQGMGEGGAERASDHVREMRAETRRAARAGAPDAAGPTRPVVADAGDAAAAHPTARGEVEAPQPHPVVPHPDTETGAHPPVHPAAEPPARPVAVEPVPVPPALHNTVPELADAVSTGPLRKVAEDVRTEAPVRADEPPVIAPRRPAAEEAAPPVPRTAANDNQPRGAASAEPTPATADKGKPGRRRPPPLPHEVVEFDHLPEMTVMLDANPISREAANDNYHALIHDDPTREVAHYYNAETGVHIVVQGTETTVYVGHDAAGNPEAPRRAGIAQEWKTMLDSDAGRWQLVAHFHPGDPVTGRSGLTTRIPSGESGDFAVVRHESRVQGDVPHESRIHFLHNGEMGYTDFGYNPHSTEGRYWIDIDNPVTGRRERHEFATMQAYGEWAEFTTGIPARKFTSPTRDAGGMPPHTTGTDITTPRSAGEGPVPHGRTTDEPDGPRGSAAGRTAAPPDEIHVMHGTSSAALASMEAQGIQLGRIRHDHQDFGRALYLTLDDANAAHYANRAAHDGRVAEAKAAQREGRPERHVAPAIVDFSLRLSDLVLAAPVRPGDPPHTKWEVVDVRPGGAHRAQWEAFLDRVPPMFPRMPPLPPGVKLPWGTTRDYIMGAGGGIEHRGQAFQAFLEHAGLAHAHAVWGDLGGVGTSGLVAEGGGQQIAIRSQALADQLTGQLPGRAARGGPGLDDDAPPVPRSANHPDDPPGRAPGEDTTAPRASEADVDSAGTPRPASEETASPGRVAAAKDEPTAGPRPATAETDIPPVPAAPAGRKGGGRKPRATAPATEEAPAAPSPKRRAAKPKLPPAAASTEEAAGTPAARKRAAPRKALAPEPEPAAGPPVRRDQPIIATRDSVEGAVQRNLPELQRIAQSAAEEVMGSREVIESAARAKAREAATIEARNAAHQIPDSEIPTMMLEMGPGLLAAAIVIRQTGLPTGMTGANSVLFTRFVWGLALGNERQFVNGPGGRFLGQGRIPGETTNRKLNYDILVQELQHYRGPNGEPLRGREFANVVREFAQTGLTLPPFHGANGAAALGEFARLIFSVEVARSTNFAVESATLLHMLETTNLSLEDAFQRASAVNPMSLRGAVKANREFEASIRGDPAAHAALMTETQRAIARKTAVSEELTPFEAVVARRRELMIRDIEAEMMKNAPVFPNDAAFLLWMREEYRRILMERARALFGIGPRPAPRSRPGTYWGFMGSLPTPQA